MNCHYIADRCGVLMRRSECVVVALYEVTTHMLHLHDLSESRTRLSLENYFSDDCSCGQSVTLINTGEYLSQLCKQGNKKGGGGNRT